MDKKEELQRIKRRDDGLWIIDGKDGVTFASKAAAAGFLGVKLEATSSVPLMLAKLAFALVAAVAFAYWATGGASRKSADENPGVQEVRQQRKARELVTARLKDPESAQFRNQAGICGEVNAKNSFGGYTGFKRFIAKSDALVFQEGDGAMPVADFQQVWSEVCQTQQSQ